MKHQLPQGFTKDIAGYCDPLSALPGEQIGFKVGAWNQAVGAQAEFKVVRLISGDARPHGTGLIEIDTDIDVAPATLIHQPLCPGSYACCPAVAGPQATCISLWVYPTLLRDSHQVVLQWGELVVRMNAGGVHCAGADGEVLVSQPLAERRWYHLSLQLGDEARLLVERQALGVAEPHQTFTASGTRIQAPEVASDLYLAASSQRQHCFNGRLQGPEIMAGQTLIARWDFALQMASQTIEDTSANGFHGQLYQNPTRAVAGVSWDGSQQSFHVAPHQYAAVHFHEDDFTDARWTDTVTLTVPLDLPSGQYALNVRCGESTDAMPFFVRARPAERGRIAYLVPTASYLAYANQRLVFTPGPFGDPRIFDANQAFLYAHEDVGLSMYEYHRDHSGVHYSSRLRPVLNMKPNNPTWAFNADTHITAWLHAIDTAYDVVTDEDLHREGAAALTGYQTVITGTHPEYYSTAMLDGLQQWLGAGGRLMYMGGNGFYWRVAFQPDNPAVMEVRRAEDGTRAWIAQAGEYYHQFGGEYGGLWRRLGRPPNQLVGIGFAAQGFDGGTYYRVQADALNPRAAFIMQGVQASDTLGHFGNQGGGAAGEEIDRWDSTLGSPAHALVLASSEHHKPGMLPVKEEFHMMEQPSADNPEVRADMVFFEVPGGGAVFSTGSISYAGSLAHNDYDNDIARLTGNVLRRFVDPEPFVMPAAPA